MVLGSESERGQDAAKALPGEEEAGGVEERRADLLAALRREIKRRGRTLEKVREERERARGAEGERRKGELLKSALGELRRGMSRVEVVDYFDPGLRTVTLELDPALGPRENIEACFRRYRKGERALAFIEKRLLKLEGEAQAAAGIVDRLEGARTAGELAALELEAAPLLKVKRRPAGPAPAPARAAGRRERGKEAGARRPRRFLSRDGWEILVGRDAASNDELTLHGARGNDLFLHVAGKAGAHVVLRTERGKSIPVETLLDAAQLALYFSLSPQERGRGGTGAAADVDYTFAKYVRKGKGMRPGLVLLIRHQTVRVRLEGERIERLLHSTEEPGEPEEMPSPHRVDPPPEG